jgi:aryl-alcohol dehydrogenase-like predicted oxidoreductase
MNLTHQQMGTTDLFISKIGLGTTKIGRNTDVKFPKPFSIPDDRQVANLLAMARDLNINLIDTAPAYGNSEERLGVLLKDQRQQWIISTKAGEEYANDHSSYDYSASAILNSIKSSLKRLRTDYIDILLIHSDGNDLEIINNYDVFSTLHKAKQQGLIRYYGMSTKTVAGGLLTIENCDLAMITYNTEHTEELTVIEAAAKLNKGIFIKKALNSGHISAEKALEFVAKQTAISSIITGTINPEHLRQNVQAVINSLAF